LCTVQGRSARGASEAVPCGRAPAAPCMLFCCHPLPSRRSGPWRARGNALRQGPGRSTQLCVAVIFRRRDMGLCSTACLQGGGRACSAGCCRGLAKVARSQLAGMLGSLVIARIVVQAYAATQTSQLVTEVTDVKPVEHLSVAALCIGQRLQAPLPSSAHSHLSDGVDKPLMCCARTAQHVVDSGVGIPSLDLSKQA